MVFALAALAGCLAAAPMAQSAEDTCGGRSAEIISKAYPAALAIYDGLFEIDGDEGGDVITPPDATVYSPQAKIMICRQWPARPDLLLVAMPIVSFWADDFTQGDIDLLVMDAKTLAVRHRLKLEDVMESDALRIGGIAFDTAFYQLSPDNVAFGLRITKANNSRANPMHQTTLRLFAIENGDLRLVLDRLLVNENRGEWNAVCIGEFQDTKRTLAMERSGKAGKAEIRLSETVVTSRFDKTEVKSDCKGIDATTTTKHRLRFKDSAYVVPEAMQGI